MAMTTGELLRLSRVHTLIDTGAARLIREQSGLRLGDLADQLEVSPAALSRWETGHRRPRRVVALRYLDQLETLTGRRAR